MIPSAEEWRKSSYSLGNGDCVEFRRSSFCHDGGCAEVATWPDGVQVRDSTDPGGPVLEFSGEEWAVFLGDVKAGTLG